MSRADLLALTPQALAQLANMGLVKRAQRELAEGLGPALSEAEDGAVTGTFPDGVIATLQRGRPLKDCTCSCGATAVCRHRIAVALGYGPWHAATNRPDALADGLADAPPDAPADAPVPPDAQGPVTKEPWSPAELSDDVLDRALGARVLERARRTVRQGLVVTIERDDVPAARLPACTVRFLVPRDVAYARCDCVDAGGACEHLALAVWAFREADATSPKGTRAVVSLGARGTVSPACAEALAEALALARDVLARGVETFQPAPIRFAQLKARLQREGAAWMHDLVLDLELALEGYHARSALHGTREVAELLVELVARTRAGLSASCELPARFVLGQGEAFQTELAHVRLVSLGARLGADGRTRYADVFLADPDTATVLRLRKRWDYEAPAEPEDGPALGARRVSGQVTLRALAHGQLVSKVVRRLANRSIEIGTSRAAQSSVTPHTGDHSALPAPLLVRDLAQHAALTSLAPPRLVRARVLAEDVHVVELSAVRDVMYSSAEQRVVARVCDAAGNDLTLALGHRRAAPHAIDATVAALDTLPRFVSGALAQTPSGFELLPLSFSGGSGPSGGGVVVPDLAGPTKVAPPPSTTTHRSAPGFDEALTATEAALEELCSAGLASASVAATGRLQSARQRLADTGLIELARRVSAVEEHTRAGRADAAASAWLDAALRLSLTREASLG